MRLTRESGEVLRGRVQKCYYGEVDLHDCGVNKLGRVKRDRGRSSLICARGHGVGAPYPPRISKWRGTQCIDKLFVYIYIYIYL